MSKSAFFRLCRILVDGGFLIETQNVPVKESVALFLHVLAHNTKFRVLGGTYIRSIDTISRHFNLVLRAILKMTSTYIKRPATSQAHRWGYFTDCVGAIDGTHIDVTVPQSEQGRYRNRKQAITTNVLGVCDADMKFVYVLPGWEGSASDSRVLRNALEREDCFEVPIGKNF
ncbi:hypothetical protein KSP39_PZI023660 [Platanthera zijinensis]|uniref:Transposase n=1 Tax=Platanthera zijinensis TaxID=2320716 RepID=A0AAP0AS77_9ASPA